MVVSGLEQLQVDAPHNPDLEDPVLQELVGAVPDLLGGYDGLHHHAGVRLLLG